MDIPKHERNGTTSLLDTRLPCYLHYEEVNILGTMGKAEHRKSLSGNQTGAEEL